MSYLVLYRKYRPQTFADVVGQEIIIQTLKNAIRYQKINHCYLFSGNKGTGKTTLAKIFAKAINCLSPIQGEAFCSCHFCQNFAKANTDITEIDGASYNGVDEIRELQDKAQYKAHAGKYKVYIIDEVHVLTPNAFNALLKILEEPPEHVVFILITTEIYKIPDTIFSRSQSFAFENLNLKNITAQLTKIAALENMFITEDAIKSIAYHSEGGMRNALSLLDQVSAYQNNLITSEDVANIKGTVSASVIKKLFQNLLKKEATKTLQLLHKSIDSGKNIDILILDLIDAIKDYLICNAKNKKYSKTSQLSQAQKILLLEETNHIDHFLRTLIKLQQDLKKSDQKKSLVEIAFLQICSLHSFQFQADLQEFQQFVTNKTKISNNNQALLELDETNAEEHYEPTKPIQKKLENPPFYKTEEIKSIQFTPIANKKTPKIEKIEYLHSTLKDLQPQNNSTISELTQQNNLPSQNSLGTKSPTKTHPYFCNSSLFDLISFAINILSNQDKPTKNTITNFWKNLKNHYSAHSYYKSVAEILDRGTIVALSQTQQIILVFEDEDVFELVLQKNIKQKALEILNNETFAITEYIAFLKQDWQALEIFYNKNYPHTNPSLIAQFTATCNFDLDLYRIKTTKSSKPAIIQLAYDFFGKDIVEIIN
ncbi:DNA polymerase III, gamma/tau subunit [Aster yellows witches'-broom phytoplasma AYWB]|uniref:DNA polymerase III subunit gamma/tau n=2 Tax=16SrI (Aster yellows group) TaxID=3042590 RepID=Q2NK09_AYWBP|nr:MULTISPECIES: DNA polymerase III subunit gamma/tau [16SrI (Aster yellows group)]ABC65234.1 DNA polymerase III, gamma/tau subunit [Aster yellows witches'-broom phytoplasma AYWB]PEH36415.1 DNA polymerase III, subunit gamma and tau [New Jersey aster yellows phytoplasma]